MSAEIIDVCVCVCVLKQQTLRYQVPERETADKKTAASSDLYQRWCWSSADNIFVSLPGEMFRRVYLCEVKAQIPLRQLLCSLNAHPICIYFKRENLHIDNSIRPHWVHWSQCLAPPGCWLSEAEEGEEMITPYIHHHILFLRIRIKSTNKVCFHARDIGTCAEHNTAFNDDLDSEWWGGGRPVLIRYLDAIIWGPAQGVQTLLPQPSMAWALSVHGDSKPLYNRWNVMKWLNGPPQSKMISTVCNVETIAEGYWSVPFYTLQPGLK